MFGWKAKATNDEAPTEPVPVPEDDEPTWADGSLGPHNPATRIYGRLSDDAEHEARLASAE